jgi:DNA-binding IclR family transcriptional regulator
MAGTQAVDRASFLLVTVLEAGRPVSFGELCERAELAKSTTSRLLTALEVAGLVRRDRNGAVIPGGVITRYARSGDHQLGISATLRPALEQVVSVTGETANLAVAAGGRIELVDQVDGSFLLGSVNWVGREVPAHASALGKVLLAFDQLPLPTEPLVALTDRTITELSALRAELERVRNSGVAIIRDELEIGLTAVAVPCYDESGSVIAAMSLSGPSGRFDERRIAGVTRLLRDHFPEPHRRAQEGVA